MEFDQVKFEQVWKRVDKTPGSFTHMNARKYFEYAAQVPGDGVIVEVGVDQGRSANVLLAVSEMTGVQVRLVDSWESILIDNYQKVLDLVKTYPKAHAVVQRLASKEAAKQLRKAVDLVLIDANHYFEAPGIDCEAWLPKIKDGGIAMFHDYQATFPAVTLAVDKYTANWEDLGSWESLAIRRKPE